MDRVSSKSPIPTNYERAISKSPNDNWDGFAMLPSSRAISPLVNPAASLRDNRPQKKKSLMIRDILKQKRTQGNYFQSPEKDSPVKFYKAAPNTRQDTVRKSPFGAHSDLARNDDERTARNSINNSQDEIENY